MTSGLEYAMNSEESEKLFFYFKHDGSIDFQKKISAGKTLYERGFDRKKLIEEKQLIIDSIKDQIRSYENINHIKEKNKKKINTDFLLGLGYIGLFTFIGLIGYIKNDKPLDSLDWIGISAFILLAISFIIYRIMTYKTKLNHFLELDMKDKELLKFRLKFIEKEWNF